MSKIWKSILAVIVGLIFIVVTHTATDKILEAIGVLPKGNLYVGTGLIVFVIGYRAVFSLIGCFLTARLAPSKPMTHALILGVIGVIGSLAGVLANYQLNLGPDWYAWTLVIISLPIAWLGGKLEVIRRKGK